VFSNTLDHVAPYARLERGDPVEVVRQLKKQPGGDMSVGGAALAASLTQHDLIDVYQVMIQQVLLGQGARMFPDLHNPIHLRLVETHSFQSGVIFLRYQRAEQAGDA
jgi:dihydrofolate reductase